MLTVYSGWKKDDWCVSVQTYMYWLSLPVYFRRGVDLCAWLLRLWHWQRGLELQAPCPMGRHKWQPEWHSGSWSNEKIMEWKIHVKTQYCEPGKLTGHLDSETSNAHIPANQLKLVSSWIHITTESILTVASLESYPIGTISLSTCKPVAENLTFGYELEFVVIDSWLRNSAPNFMCDVSDLKQAWEARFHTP